MSAMPSSDANLPLSTSSSTAAVSKNQSMTRYETSTVAQVLNPHQTDAAHRPRTFELSTSTPPTPRGRTGCLTCRGRRIKCDEAKPHCRNCIKSKRSCQYGILQQPRALNPVQMQAAIAKREQTVQGSWHAGFQPDSPEDSPPAEPLQRQIEQASQIKPLPEAILRKSQSTSPEVEETLGVEPSPSPTVPFMPVGRLRFEKANVREKTWDYVDAWRYYVQIIRYRSNDMEEYEPAKLNSMMNYDKNAIILMTISDYLNIVSTANRSLPVAGELPGLGPVWVNLYEYIDRAIRSINGCFENMTPQKKQTALLRITDLTATEFRILGTAWQKHIRGYFTLAQKGEGLTLAVEQNVVFRCSISWMLNSTVFSNTISPPSQQITEIYNWSFEQLRMLQSYRFSVQFPCPSVLFIDIIRLTRLRMLAIGVSFKKTIVPEAQDIFRHVESLSPRDWTESYGVLTSPRTYSIFQMFQTATILYGVLSLTPKSGGDGIYHTSRLALREKLLHQMRNHMQHKAAILHMSWPVAVVAVALKDGSRADKSFIEEVVMNLKGDKDEYYVPNAVVRKIREFWKSDKTHWDDMYNQPNQPFT